VAAVASIEMACCVYCAPAPPWLAMAQVPGRATEALGWQPQRDRERRTSNARISSILYPLRVGRNLRGRCARSSRRVAPRPAAAQRLYKLHTAAVIARTRKVLETTSLVQDLSLRIAVMQDFDLRGGEYGDRHGPWVVATTRPECRNESRSGSSSASRAASCIKPRMRSGP